MVGAAWTVWNVIDQENDEMRPASEIVRKPLGVWETLPPAQTSAATSATLWDDYYT